MERDGQMEMKLCRDQEDGRTGTGKGEREVKGGRRQTGRGVYRE